ncbi:hypothetical protein LLH03_09225 [bacterium]|nr:hypothetical protein [bacterium]
MAAAYGQETPAPVTPAPPTPLEAADQAARAFDYATALKSLEQAASSASAEDAARLKQRQALYEQYLGLTTLVDLARDNPDRLVGVATTRGGRKLAGLVQMAELGIKPEARIGNRVIDDGAFALAVSAESTVTVKAREIAQFAVTWAAPTPEGWPNYWSIAKIHAVLQTGEVVEGKPTWFLPLSTLTVRETPDAEDTTIAVYPAMGKPISADDLLSEVILVGAPPMP